MRAVLLVAASSLVTGAHVNVLGERWRARRLKAGLPAVPSWEPTWSVSRSTAFMPCNYSGLFNLSVATAYGLADYDWSNGKQIWANAQPMDCEELLVEQAAATKAYDSNTRVFVYRNFVKALPWYTSVRERISDPAYAGWFLRFGPPTVNGSKWHVPQCDNNYDPPLCSDFYHDQEQTPGHPHGDGNCVDACDCGGVPCGEYLWDHRNESLRQYLIDNVLGPTGLGDPNITGFYFDDGWSDHPDPVPDWEKPPGACDSSPIGGATEEDYNCSLDMGLVQADTTALTSSHDATMTAVFDAVVAAGGWAWQLWYGWSTPVPAECATTFRTLCNQGNTSEVYLSALLLQWTNTTPGHTELLQPAEDFAAFQLVRGPFAWIGYAWVGCLTSYPLPAELALDYGTPTGTCQETAPGSGVFTRDWTLSTATMDCNTYKGSVVIKQ